MDEDDHMSESEEVGQDSDSHLPYSFYRDVQNYLRGITKNFFEKEKLFVDPGKKEEYVIVEWELPCLEKQQEEEEEEGNESKPKAQKMMSERTVFNIT